MGKGKIELEMEIVEGEEVLVPIADKGRVEVGVDMKGNMWKAVERGREKSGDGKEIKDRDTG